MRKLLVLISLLPCLLFSQASNPPRRLNNPQQYVFGNFSQMSPGIHAANYTTITDTTQILPTALVSNTETFGSTTDFTVTSSGQAFSVASSKGTISASGASTGLYSVNATASGQITTAPDWMLPITINQQGVAATANLIENGGCKADNSVRVMAVLDIVNNKAEIESFSGGVSTMLGAVTYTPPSPPYDLALKALGNEAGTTDVGVWIHSGGSWSQITTANLGSAYNLATASNLSGLTNCFYISTGAATTTSWQVSNMIEGAFGWTQIVNPTGVQYPSARAVTDGNKIDLLTGIDGTSGGIFSYDTSAGTIALFSKIWINNSGTIQDIGQIHLLYNPVTANYRATVDGWALNGGNSDNTNIYYTTIPKSTLDWLSPGVHVIPWASFTQLTHLSVSHGWDHALACAAGFLNASTGACSKWLMAYLAVVSPGTTYAGYLDYTTADPATNPTWTNISNTVTSGSLAYGGLKEGWNFARTRTTTGSVGYSIYPFTTTLVYPFNVYYDSALSFQGPSDAFSPYSSTSIPHTVFAFMGNYAYMFSNDANCFGASSCTGAGQWEVAKAPINVTGATVEQMASAGVTTGSRASVTTGATTIPAGTYVAFATAQSGSSMTVTSSPSATWSLLASNMSSGGQVEYCASLPSGSTTFTATPSVSSAYLGLVVFRVIGATCSQDSTATKVISNSGSNPLNVTGIAASQTDLGLLCFFSYPNSSGFGTPTFNGTVMQPAGTDSGGVNTGGYMGCYGKTTLGPLSGAVVSVSPSATIPSFGGFFTGLKLTNYAPFNEPPVASLASRTFYGTLSVTLSTAVSGAAICYTTDGTAPTADGAGTCTHGTTYSGAISVTSTETLKAIASKIGYQDSLLASYAYTLTAAPLQYLYAHNQSTGGNQSTTQTVIAGVPYFVACSNASSIGSTAISSSPAATWTTVAVGGTNAPSFINVGWAVFASNGPVTFTCTMGGTFSGMDVLECPACNGTVGSTFTGSTATSTLTVSSISAAAQNITVIFDAVFGTTVSSGTAAGTSINFLANPGGLWQWGWAANSSYSGQSAVLTLAGTPGRTAQGVVIPADY